MEQEKKWYHRALESEEKLTPKFVRDEMVECFFTSQNQILALAAKTIHREMSDEDLRKNVCQIIKMAFREARGDFDMPTKVHLLKVMDILKRKSQATGKEAEIIRHHGLQMMELVKQLE